MPQLMERRKHQSCLSVENVLSKENNKEGELHIKVTYPFRAINFWIILSVEVTRKVIAAWVCWLVAPPANVYAATSEIYRQLASDRPESQNNHNLMILDIFTFHWRVHGTFAKSQLLFCRKGEDRHHNLWLAKKCPESLFCPAWQFWQLASFISDWLEKFTN